MTRRVVWALLGTLCLLGMPPSARATFLDFENAASLGLAEGDAITNQFEPTTGISFSYIGGAPGPQQLARRGSPVYAFGSGPGFDDTLFDPAPFGNYFLGGGPNAIGTSFSFRMNFSQPITAVSAYILDIDPPEVFQLTLEDASGTALATRTLDINTPGAGNGLATPFTFSRPQGDAVSLRFDMSRSNQAYLGFAVDNIAVTFVSTFGVPEPAALALLLTSALTVSLARMRNRH